jgi:hypothetical protein
MPCPTRSCSGVTCRSCTERRRQHGQTAVEFLFALLIIIAGLAGLYQVLHFERDVFNRLLYLRQVTFRQMHVDQDTTKKTFFAVGPTEFRPVGALLHSPVPLQVLDPALRYPSKYLHVRKGTRFYDPLEAVPFSHGFGEIYGSMVVGDLWEVSLRWRTRFAAPPVIIGAYPDPLDQNGS